GFGEQLVALQSLADRVRQHQLGRIAARGDGPRADVHAGIAEQVIVLRVAQRFFDMNHAVACFERRVLYAAGVQLVAGRADDVSVAHRDYVRGGLDLVLVEQRRTAHEARDDVVRNGRDCLAERLAAHLGRQSLDAGAGLGALGYREPRLAVHVDQPQHVAWVNEMRVGDLRIDVPDLRPIPGVAQEQLGDVPKGVARLHDILAGGLWRQGDAAGLPDGALLFCGRADRAE